MSEGIRIKDLQNAEPIADENFDDFRFALDAPKQDTTLYLPGSFFKKIFGRIKHAISHYTGGEDEIKPYDISAARKNGDSDIDFWVKNLAITESLQTSDYTPSLPGIPESGAGAGLTKDEYGRWTLEVHYLLAKLAIIAPELIKNRITVTNNQTWFSDNGIVESVEAAEADNERIVTIAKERGGGSTFKVDDLLLGIILNEENGGLTYQKVQLLVREVIEPYRLRVSLELPTAPIVDLILVRTGNRVNLERQNSIFIDASLPAIFYYVGVDSFDITTEYIAQATGNLRGMNFGKLTQYKPIQERFSNVIRGNNYQSGKFFGISGDGVEYPMVVERGAWVEWDTYYHYDRVSHNGSLWDCAVESTREEPHVNSHYWSRSVSRGEPGDPAPLLKTQFSADGISDWHDTYRQGDAYRRESNNNGSTWSGAMRMKGENGGIGKDGQRAPYSDFSYAYGTFEPDKANDSLWSDTPPSKVDGANLYERIRKYIVNVDNSGWTLASVSVAMINECIEIGGANFLRSIPWVLPDSTTSVYELNKNSYPELFGRLITFKLHQFIVDFRRMWIEEADAGGRITSQTGFESDQNQKITLTTKTHSAILRIVVQTNYVSAPKLIKAKLEQGNIATSWSVSEEDQKQTELEIRAVTDNFTAQDGGMFMTSLIKLLNSGREMAGFSGLGAGSDPALWIGGTYADALANNTSVVMRAHGGSKIGTLSIDDKGLGAFTNQSDKRWMMLYDELVPEMEHFLRQPYNQTDQVDASQIFVPQFNIESQYLTTIYLGWNKLSAVELKTSITLYAYEPNPTVHGGTVTASVYLTATSGNILIGTYSHSVGTYAKPGDQAQDYRTFPIVYSSNALPNRGRIIVKYSMTASHYPTGGYYDDFRGSVQLMNATAMTSWNLKSFIGKGLAMFVDNNNYIHFGYNNETGSQAEPRKLAFRIKSYEDPDMPGVLASCRIEEDGKINRNLSYGSKISLLNDGIRDSNGKYTVYHSIGHTQYQVYVTLCGSLFGFARVVTRSKDRVTIEIVDHKNSAYSNSAFNILLVGNNQIKN